MPGRRFGGIRVGGRYVRVSRRHQSTRGFGPSTTEGASDDWRWPDWVFLVSGVIGGLILVFNLRPSGLTATIIFFVGFVGGAVVGFVPALFLDLCLRSRAFRADQESSPASMSNEPTAVGYSPEAARPFVNAPNVIQVCRVLLSDSGVGSKTTSSFFVSRPWTVEFAVQFQTGNIGSFDLTAIRDDGLVGLTSSSIGVDFSDDIQGTMVGMMRLVVSTSSDCVWVLSVAS